MTGTKLSASQHFLIESIFEKIKEHNDGQQDELIVNNTLRRLGICLLNEIGPSLKLSHEFNDSGLLEWVKRAVSNVITDRDEQKYIFALVIHRLVALAVVPFVQRYGMKQHQPA